MDYKYLHAFNSRNDLKTKYGNNSLLLYALELRYDIDDIHSIAAESLTDGNNDKKCDLIFLDIDNGFAVIAQAYMKQKPTEHDLAPSNKACDLNTAAAWLFKTNAGDIPEQIRDEIRAVQDAIKSGDINTIYFWYVHNLNESNNPEVQKELNTVQEYAQKASKNFNSEGDLNIICLEVGNEQIEKWFENSHKRIVITDRIEVENIDNGFEIRIREWQAYVTAVSGKWLRNLYLKYKQDELFSGNPRNFLGAGTRKNKINLGIKNTVIEEPNNFWAYNNGLTALVNKYEIDNGKLVLTGITIINGAQTTGAIGSVEELCDDFLVPIRFIICNDPQIIDKIVNNNNKQNEILPSDLRSNDRQQERLRNEFEKYPQLFYSGGKRTDKRTRNKEVFDPYVVAQTLLAFHSDPVFAYNNRKAIWDDDKQYTSIFSDILSAEHIIFVYSLSRAIDEYKWDLKEKKETRTTNEEQQLLFLSKRGSKMLLIYSISSSLDNLVSKRITDSWKLQFAKNNNFSELVNKWKSVLRGMTPFCSVLLSALESGLKNKEKVREVTIIFNSTIAALHDTLSTQLSDYISSLKY